MKPQIETENAGIILKGISFEDEHGYIEKARRILKVVGNLRLVGETGTGKTIMVHKLAELLDSPLLEIVLTRDVTKWDLLACETLKNGSSEVRDGIIMQWLNSKKGGILYIDGFNYAEPSIISLLESLADFRGSVWIPEKQGQFVRTDKHYLVISYNPSDKAGYSGTFIENIATIRRFEGLIIEYLSPRKERALVKRFSKNYNFSAKFVEMAGKTRIEYENGKLRTPITTGNLINYGKLYADGMSEEDIVDIASSLYTAKEERNLFLAMFEDSKGIDIEKLKSEDGSNL